MKTALTLILFLLVTVSYALASGGNGFESLGLMSIFFIIFGLFIVLFQLVPGLMLLFWVLKGMFSSVDNEALDIGSK